MCGGAEVSLWAEHEPQAVAGLPVAALAPDTTALIKNGVLRALLEFGTAEPPVRARSAPASYLDYA